MTRDATGAFVDERGLTVDHHIHEIEEWIDEAYTDQGLEGDEVAWDVVTSYICAYISGGEGTPMAREIRRCMFGFDMEGNDL